MPTLPEADRRLIDAFSQPIPPVRSTVIYRLSLLLVSAAMVALPLIYLALIGLAGWWVCWWAVHGLDLFDSPYGRHHASRASLFVYLAPLVIGAVVTVFMLKPLFAPRPRMAKPLTLDPAQEPLLFAFVERLCATVGAPAPRRIEVACEVNASARLTRGWWSLLTRDLTLSIGLPLAAGLTLRQFTGVLAHEFGHFAQGAGMRASFVVRSVNMWFARVVYQRDALDEWLVSAASGSENVHWGLALMLHLARACVWLTRLILRVLMLIGHLVSSLLSRQMEFDADRHAYRVVGCEAFASALRDLPVVCLAERGAQHDLADAWRERRLGDDLPALIAANIPQIPAELKQRAIADGMTANASMYDSHPATRDRIAAGERERSPGVFAADGSASLLFRDFPALCRKATLLWYRDSAGLRIEPKALIPTQSLVERSARLGAVAKAHARWFGGLWTRGLMWVPPEAPAAAREEATLAQAAAAASAAQGDADDAHQAFGASEERLVQAVVAGALIEAGVELKPGQFGLARPSASAATTAAQQARAQRDQLRQRCAGAAEGQRLRMAQALAGLDGESTARAAQATRALAAIATRQDALDRLREDLTALGALARLLERNQQNERLLGALRRRLGALRTQLTALSEAWRDVVYPAEHGGDSTLAIALIGEVPGADDLGGIGGCCERALDGAMALHARMLGELAMLAEARTAAASP
jgi:hypothetical protein